jgi:hypothetical protein
LDVTYDNIPVPGSTFRTQAIAGCDPRRVKAYGPGKIIILKIMILLAFHF